LKTYVIVSVSFYVLLNYVNIDVFIAERNLQAYAKTGKIDVMYMETLSDDVVPYLVKLEEETGLKSVYFEHRKEFIQREDKTWPEWNWSTYKAHTFLSEKNRVSKETLFYKD
jgi:hypothetical protein